MKIPSVLWVVVGLLISSNMAIAEAYKWKDSSGRTHYGNELPDNVSNVSEVPIYECLSEECNAERAAQSVEQERIYKEMREQQMERDKLKAQQTPKPTTVYVPMVVPSPYPIPYGGTVFTGSNDVRRRRHPKPELFRDGRLSESRKQNSRHSTKHRGTGGGINLRAK